MSGRDNPTCNLRSTEETVKNMLQMKNFVGVASLGFGLLVAGCKTSPDFTAANAQALIQAKYDSTPPAGADVRVDDLGMRQGITAKYWDRTKMYPNKFWADFKLTDEGKKAIKLPAGGDVIQWRPETAGDTNYSLIVNTAAANHLKAKDVQDPQSETDGTKTVVFSEAVSLDGVPAPLSEIAHNPGNKLATKRTATFSLENGAWKLDSIT
jgi:hypothetical protein